MMVTTHRWPLVLIPIAAIAASAGCVVSADDLYGRPCESNTDCPERFYACVDVPGGQGKTCEVIFPSSLNPNLADAGSGGGGTVPKHYYCTDIQPILNR